MTMIGRAELERVLEVTRRASAGVMRVYAEGAIRVDFKAPDDPVTRADREANALLVEGLSKAFPGVPIVAEESPPEDYANFRDADACWFVDPVDGTREFIDRNGQFAVMVGLVVGSRPVLGVVDECAHDRCFAAAVGTGAFEVSRDGASWQPLRVSSQKDVAAARVVSSRSRPSPRLSAALATVGIPASHPIGSCGIKGARVASAEADAYAHIEQAGYRWDACAAEAIVTAAGGLVTDARGELLDYRAASLANSAGLLMTNGALHEALVRALTA